MSAADLAYIVRRTALTGLAIGALVAGVAAASATVRGFALAGVVAEPPGGRVTFVSPTGFAWREGIRMGQQVLVDRAIDDPGGFFLATADGSTNYAVRGLPYDDALRGMRPLGIAALGLAVIALLFLRTRRRWVLPIASIAIAVAAFPLETEGAPDVSTAVMGAALLVPGSALVLRLPGGQALRLTALAVLLAFLATWGAARLLGWDEARVLNDYRGWLALWALAALVAVRLVLPLLAREPMTAIRPSLLDLAIVAATAVTGLLVVNVVDASIVVVGALGLLAVAALPSTRRKLARPIENVLLGDIREAAAAEGAEQERARLARELHDVPLQELAAVIRRLEIVPGAESESEDLRALASHLRNVATELRPPVLDDLGLAAAFDYLAEEVTTAAVPVVAEVVDETGFGADRRPPADVELAMYRIASEAVGNAIRHSGGSQVHVRAVVAPRRVELVVADDGAGLGRDAAREAAKQKRLGLASMRRRAQAIDAELSIDGSARGTQVTAVWQA